jgi:ribosomal-protein-alanine N-acetyltransferase
MEPSDVPVVAAVERACFPTAWDPHAYHNELANPAAVYVVARCCGGVVAYAGMWVAMDEAHFTMVGVVAGHRRRGIGARLVSALLDEAVARGATRATLEVRERNVGAQRLYESFGFKEAGRRAGYYTDTGEAAVIMWAEGLDSPEAVAARPTGSVRTDGHLGGGVLRDRVSN